MHDSELTVTQLHPGGARGRSPACMQAISALLRQPRHSVPEMRKHLRYQAMRQWTPASQNHINPLCSNRASRICLSRGPSGHPPLTGAPPACAPTPIVCARRPPIPTVPQISFFGHIVSSPYLLRGSGVYTLMSIYIPIFSRRLRPISLNLAFFSQKSLPTTSICQQTTRVNFIVNACRTLLLPPEALHQQA